MKKTGLSAGNDMAISKEGLPSRAALPLSNRVPASDRRNGGSGGANLDRGEDPGHRTRRPRHETMRHWITSFPLLTTNFSVYYQQLRGLLLSLQTYRVAYGVARTPVHLPLPGEGDIIRVGDPCQAIAID